MDLLSALTNIRFWRIAAFAATHHFGRYWTKSGHWPAPALNGSVEIDPSATLALQRNSALRC
jgi:hypothetical protein